MAVKTSTRNAQFLHQVRQSMFNLSAVKIADMTTRNAQFNSDALIKVADLDNRNYSSMSTRRSRFQDMTTVKRTVQRRRPIMWPTSTIAIRSSMSIMAVKVADLTTKNAQFNASATLERCGAEPAGRSDRS